MQTINNLILNTNAAAADGAWRNVSNFVASSIQIVARDAATGLLTPLTGTIWIEVSNDPNVNIDNLATQIAAPGASGNPAAPVLSQFTPSSQGDQAAYTFPAVTYGVKLTYVNLAGETVVSSAATLAVSAGNTVAIAAPGQDVGGYATGFNVYMNVNGGTYYLQNPLYNSGGTFGNLAVANGPIPVNQGFILYAFQNSGILIPSANTTATPNVGVNISGNLNTTPSAGQPDNEAAVAYDTATGVYGAGVNMVMWAPSCLYFNWVRVRVSGQTAGHVLSAYLFGQNG